MTKKIQSEGRGCLCWLRNIKSAKQNAFDCLYAKSKENKVFINLMEMITSEENIKLAYRTIKRNTGSKTPGTDGRTIYDLASMQEQQFVRLIKRQFQNYHPKPVKRVEIPKPNGKMRPLGIPVIIDRIVQQLSSVKKSISWSMLCSKRTSCTTWKSWIYLKSKWQNSMNYGQWRCCQP